MEDEIRNRHEMKLLAQEGKPSITNYTYNPTNFTLPAYLQVPMELNLAQSNLHQAAYNAIRGMKEIMHFRDYRFSFLCPQTPKSDWTIHCMSMQRLREWQKYTYPPPPTNPGLVRNDFTLAPRPRLPKEAICIRLDSKYYGRFVSSYVNFLDDFFHGAWTEYMKWKHEVESLAAHVLSEFVYHEWRYWWDTEFCINMRKWEGCCALLPMPLWEDVIDELYLMIVDRVEEPDQIASSLWRIGGRYGQESLVKIESRSGASLFMGLDVVNDVDTEVNVYLAPDASHPTRGVDEGDEEIHVCLDVRTIDFALRV
ncbi:hypothetical protein N7509_009650 [Penicillium cosmopolitanum]|uniref:Uncharacterized protein n=1 Tax=Penicillium cosmopolitanum TaxID=1131564 RepID=A0A9X0B3S9_9EURO|nr:uncharacterized protein N7509_009650 [Penicillium cosmopolitanum]KAJ5387109.1 hypothetical protein N7509_009650 [Penicillium cosmopolitanum]